jgi:hypothetical protein
MSVSFAAAIGAAHHASSDLSCAPEPENTTNVVVTINGRLPISPPATK